MFQDARPGPGPGPGAAAALQALCRELNLDEGSAAEALRDFAAIRGNYSLEVLLHGFTDPTCLEDILETWSLSSSLHLP